MNGSGKGKKALAKVMLPMLKRGIFLKSFLKWGEKQLMRVLMEQNVQNRPLGSQEDKVAMVQNLMHSFDAKLKAGTISRGTKSWVFDTFIRDIILNWREKYPHAYEKRRNNETLPAFITISPTQKCNLACIGCYAASSSKTPAYLDWNTVDTIMNQKRELWGSHFTVISGGEPLLWESEGRGILDLFEKHHDNWFLMYTNGTLIDKEKARRMGELGNVSPAISVEGFEEDTDYRRGKGTYGKIIEAMDNLREAGVLYGISFTATRKNVDRLLSDEFIDEFYGPHGATFGWMFQYMPIGRGPDFELMITPEQRRKLWYQEQHLLKEKGIFFVDFWNGGPLSDGCISAGRKGGYLYIDWNGNVMPCVFVPYTVGNVRTDFFDRGKTLQDIIETPFFQKLRNWQNNYSFKKPAKETGNEIVPCPIRDHHREFHIIAEETEAKPVDATTERSFKDKQYVDELTDIGKKVDELTRDIWVQKYQKA
jgi:MoaA/NifB/PqqE/SkfB family radical SAM enzyme